MERHENPYVLTCPWEEIRGSLWDFFETVQVVTRIKAVLLKLERAHKSPGHLVQMDDGDPGGLGQGWRFCIPNQPPGAAGAAGPDHTCRHAVRDGLLIRVYTFLANPLKFE